MITRRRVLLAGGIGLGGKHVELIRELVPRAVKLVHRAQVIEFAASARLPAIYGTANIARDGGLVSYGLLVVEHYVMAARYVDKTLKGAKAADLPVEQPTRFELVVNLKTAKALGLTIPPSVLARADEVVP